MRVYLARLASTEQQHLDLVLRHNLVSPELILDFFIAYKYGRDGISQRMGLERRRTSSSLFIDYGRLDTTHDEREEGERKEKEGSKEKVSWGVEEE